MMRKAWKRFAAFVGFSCIWVGTLHADAFAQGQPEPFRPLVFIPGILGTELRDEDEKVVWEMPHRYPISKNLNSAQVRHSRHFTRAA
jgi:hypothetical protein